MTRVLWLLGLSVLAYCCCVDASSLTLELQASSTGGGPALSGTTGQTVNKTLELPTDGDTACLSVAGVADPGMLFNSVAVVAGVMPAGTVLMLYNQTNCTQSLSVGAFFPSPSPYTVIPGSEANGSNGYSVIGSFLSLQFHVPVTGGPIQDGFYNLVQGPPYTNQASSDGDCNSFLSSGSQNSSLSFAPTDDKSGVAQFLFQLVKAPDQYTISIPRGRSSTSDIAAPAMLAAPACSDDSQEVQLTDLAPASAATTWVVGSVGSTTGNNGFGFQANISSLARANGACAEANATTLGVVVPASSSSSNNGDFSTACQLEAGVFLIPGANVDLQSNTGGWALLPVSPSYCYSTLGTCDPGDPSDDST